MIKQVCHPMIKPKTLLLLLLVLLILLSTLSLKTGVFRFPTLLTVQAVDCKTQYGLCTVEEERQVSNLIGEDFFALDNNLFGTKLIESDFRIRRVLIEKIFPNRLTVILEKRKAVLGLMNETGVFLVDQEGVIVSFAKTSSLPMLQIGNSANFVVGEHVSKEIMPALKIIYLVNKLQGVNTAYFENGEVRIQLPDEITAYFSSEGDIEARVGALQLILTRRKIDGKSPKTIDLRYSKPVLRY